MDPENPEATGLMHFYRVDHPTKILDGKKAKMWKFVTAEQYEERKDELPDLCFATRHPIKALAQCAKNIADNTASYLEWTYNDLPDLDALAEEVEFSDDVSQEELIK